MTLLVIASLARYNVLILSIIEYNVLIANEYFKLICDNYLVNETHLYHIKANYSHCKSPNVCTCVLNILVIDKVANRV